MLARRRNETPMTGPTLMANLLTQARFPLTAVYCVFLFRGRYTPLILGPVFAAVVISDILDGKIARRCDVKTDFGAVLDVSADLFFILASLTTLCLQRLFPAWGIAAIGLKFLEFWITSRFAQSPDSAYFWFDLPGRCAVSIWYALPILIPIYAFYRPNAETAAVVSAILIPTAALSLVSGLRRIRKTISGRS